MEDALNPPESWFSIPEAAEYLGVSRPTLFRWMKNGLVSFYKVGGSTRFSKEGLDAVIEKTTGQKEAEAAAGDLGSDDADDAAGQQGSESGQRVPTSP